MAYITAQIIGLILGSLGMVLTCIVTAMTQWRISIIVENDAQAFGQRIDGQWMSRWDGLWITCLRQANIQTQCDSYNSMVSLTPDLKAGRILMCFAVVFSILAFITAMVGMLFNRCQGDNDAGKNCLLLTAGIAYIIAGILVFIPVTWTAANITREVCISVCQNVQRQEMGEALFLGWPTVLLLFIAGLILCCVCPSRVKMENHQYQAPRCQPDEGYELQPMKRVERSNHLIQHYI